MKQELAARDGARIALSRGAPALIVFSSTLFLSALLLFALQPMVTRMILPALGGTPAVWAVSTCFYQVVLLGGYCYAHVISRAAYGKVGILFHLLVLAIAALALPLAPPVTADPPPNGEVMWLIGVLFRTVGLPFFAISATAPLLQAWFSRTGSDHADDPYFLYGASNLGSLIALLSYPFLIEPMIGLRSQAQLWGACFVALATLVTVCAGFVIQARPGDRAGAARETAPAAVSAPDRSTTWADRLNWLLLSLCPSALLVAFTTYLTTDVASAPLFWVVPLALYLATFIVTFRNQELVSQRVLSLILVAATAFLMPLFCGVSVGLLLTLALSFTPFLVGALVCHRELYLSRPAAAHLTEFYLCMSVGGAIGGILSAIVAPQVFTTVAEFPVLCVMCVFLAPHVRKAVMSAADRQAFASFAGVFALTLAATSWLARDMTLFGLRLPILLLLTMIPLVAFHRHPRVQAWGIVAVLAAGQLLPDGGAILHRSRNFFGAIRVAAVEDGAFRLFTHGTTIHGGQRLRDADGRAIDPPVPAFYYADGGPNARGLALARQLSNGSPDGFRAGIVGLGVGAMACHSRPGEAWRFYEIDPAVVSIARDGSMFTFLARCQPNADIVLGDARLTLAKEPASRFDYLLIDAFSSDSIPTHLLTIEAIRLYLAKLSETGVLTLHLSNRYMELVDVVRAAVNTIPGYRAVVVRDAKPTAPDATPSIAVYVLSTAHPDAVEGQQDLPAVRAQMWSDDYADVLSAIWRKRATR